MAVCPHSFKGCDILVLLLLLLNLHPNWQWTPPWASLWNQERAKCCSFSYASFQAYFEHVRKWYWWMRAVHRTITFLNTFSHFDTRLLFSLLSITLQPFTHTHCCHSAPIISVPCDCVKLVLCYSYVHCNSPCLIFLCFFIILFLSPSLWLLLRI